MLSFEDDLPVNTAQPGLGLRTATAEAPARVGARRAATCSPSRCRSAPRSPNCRSRRGPRAGRDRIHPHAPHPRRRQARHQRRHRREPARAVQVQVGVGQIPVRLRQPLDAAGSEHAARHRAVEDAQRPDRRRAPPHQAQPRLLRHRRFAGRQQHRARHLPPHHRARVPPVPAAPGFRGSDPHARLPVHRRERSAWTKAKCSTPITKCSRSATRTNS
jgi:hypothetical protein